MCVTCGLTDSSRSWVSSFYTIGTPNTPFPITHHNHCKCDNMVAAESVVGWAPPVVPLGKEVVIVLVGPEQEKFAVHKDLFCASSHFFSSALKGGFNEALSGVIKLPEVAPNYFEFLYRWLYSPPRQNGDPLYQQVPDADSEPDIILLNIYVMADYLLVPGLKLLALEQLRDLFSSNDPTIPSHGFIKVLFEDGNQKSIQLYLVKHIAFWLSKSQDRDEWVELIKVHDKLALEMAVEFANLDTTHVDALKVVHPSKVFSLEVEDGMNLVTLAVEARQNDIEPTEVSGAKVLGKFHLT